IPKMLLDGKKMMSYKFDKYWKDVGTLTSLWEANMELIGDVKFDLFDPQWVIKSRNPNEPPQYIGEDAVIENSLIGGGCKLDGEVVSSVLSSGVVLGKNSKIIDSVIFSNVKIGDNCTIEYSIIDENVVIEDNTTVGGNKDNSDITVIGRDVVIASGKNVESGCMIDGEVK
ncbi:MAG: glucose-1-phosphate adenylyltransferase, partial [Clostridia bacterium]|nr:glucose-1-phosphate adenylyltransferase [Clostridia bacterium]